MFLEIPQRSRGRRRRALAGRSIEILEERVLLADGINPAPGLHFLGNPGVALNNVAVATFTIANSSGSPGTKWDAHVNWGDGNSDKKIAATAGPNGTFQFLDSHSYANPGTFTITVMIAVPGSHTPNDNTVTTQAVITSATLQSIAVTPANPIVPLGQTEQFTATGTFSDNSTLNLTTFTTWASATPSVATISNDTLGTQGLATTFAVGTSNISATLNGVTGTTVLTVSAAVLQSIAVTPANPTVPLGETEQFTATGTYSDNSTQKLTSQVTWVSATTSVATISNSSGSQGLATTAATGTSSISATLNGVTGTTVLTVSAAVLQSIAVTPANPSVPKGETQQFTATGTYSDKSTQDLTSQVAWASATTSVATISNVSGSQGLATGVATGMSTVNATLNGVTGSTVLTVSAAVLQSIALTPANPSVPAGETEQFTAIGTYSDKSTQNLTSQVTWASATSSVATISNSSGSQGLATTLVTGTSSISATLNGVTGTTVLTVSAAVLQSITVTPANPTAPLGETEQFTATGTYSDKSTQILTSQVTWASATKSVATISNAAGSQGLATTVATGTSSISATLNGITGTTVLTVSAAVLQSIALSPANPSVPKGETEQFTATGTYSDNSTQNLTSQVTWASATTSVATITVAGLATAGATGTSTISATLSRITGSTVLTVGAAVLQLIALTPSSPSIAKGETEQFTATGTYSDNSTQDLTSLVTWASATTSVATISNTPGTQGFATALTTGTSTISATLGGIAGSTVLTVTAAALESIAVTPASPNLPKGETEQFSAMGTYSDQSTQDLTSQVTWASATIVVATITSAGLATGVTTGTSTISAALNGITGSTVLTVSPAALLSIAVTPDNPFVPNGNIQQFTATGTFSDKSTEDLTSQVTWDSATASVATISNAAGSQGLATAVSEGTATISGSLAGISGSTVLTVTAALASIAVSPADPSVPAGETQQFAATGTFSDGSTENLTNQVAWASATTSVATISNASGSQGLVTAVVQGTSTISAAFDGITGSTMLTVSPAALLSIAVTPANPSVPKGETQPFTAKGTYSDLSTQDLTSQVTWASVTTSVATINAAGLAIGVATGSSTINATLGDITGSTALTVSPAALLSIALTPVNPSVPKGETQQFTATGTYSDQSTQDLTSQVTWPSATPSVATISNTPGSKGLTTGLAIGTSTLSATLDGIAGTAVLTVSPAALISIAVSPTDPSIVQGTTEQFTATGTFSDKSTKDLTSQVTWTAANPSAASVTAAGLASGLTSGTSTITAFLNGATASTLLTVTPKPPPPLVVETHVQIVQNKKHLVTQITVDFSGAVNAAEAASVATYRLATAGKKGSFDAKNAVVFKLKSAVYVAAQTDVILTPKKPFALSKPVQLRVNGNPPAGLQDSLGRFIDGDHNGQPGGNAVAVLNRKGVTLSSLALARSSGGPNLQTAAVDVVLDQMIRRDRATSATSLRG